MTLTKGYITINSEDVIKIYVKHGTNLNLFSKLQVLLVVQTDISSLLCSHRSKDFRLTYMFCDV